jgi:hypothetical protein
MSTRKGVKSLTSLSRFIRKRGVVAALVLFLGLTLLPAMAPSPAFSQSAPQVLDKTIGQWSAAWWQWLTSIPTATNPLLDPTGQFSGVNQSGPVWFLVGAPGTGTVTRTSTVPAEKYIFFPITNIIWVKFPGDPETESFIRTLLDGSITPQGGVLASTLDGVPTVFNYRTPTVRTQSPVFAAKHIPADNIFGVPIPAGSIGFSDGFWVMLPPLKHGGHVLQFRAGGADVTYNLTVH